MIVFVLLAAALAAPLDPALVERLARGDGQERQEAVAALVSRGDPSVLPLLRALQDGNLYVAATGAPLVDEGGALHDAATGAPSTASKDDLEQVSINNRLRRTLELAIHALSLSLPNADARLAAAHALQEAGEDDALPAIDAALAREQDVRVRPVLLQAQAALSLASPEPQRRLLAIERLRQLPGPVSKRQLMQRVEPEKDPAVHAALLSALSDLDAKLRAAELVGLFFGGLSVASILLLAALGLAITFGLMGVINMAHGELLMVGAYATWAVQGAMKGALSSWYLLLAVPASFLAAALAGVLLEVLVVRRLYGRPLETLLATWGASLLIIQTVRSLFGAQNVEVANPPFMSGGIDLLPGLVVPWNRIVIIVFAGCVVLLVHLLLTRTRLGLLVRAVTQDRQRAGGLGVVTPRVDLLAFALGSGIAGLGGCALSQVGNVGPELGQGFIVDSFMVVVLGGVGQLAGTVVAAIGLGVVNKLLEPTAGAVMAKILVLAFVILFIQRRPQGLFALRGRHVDEG